MNNKTLSNTIDNSNNIRAVSYMLLAVLFYSLLPIFLHIGEGFKSPFTYNAVMSFFARMGILIYLIVFFRQQLFNREIWQAIHLNWRRISLIGALLGTFDYAMFGWALKYIDVSVAAILHETWPVWMILLTSKIFRNENKYEKINMQGWTYISIGFLGLCFVVFSHTDHDAMGMENISSPYLFLGSLMAITAAWMAALHGGCTIRWGVDAMRHLSKHQKNKTNEDLTMFFIMIAMILTGIPSIAISGALGMWGGHYESVELKNMTVAAIHGFFITVAAQIFFRKANLVTTKLGINALSYLTPVLSLILLALMGYVNAPRTEWLIIGTIAIVTANVLLSFKTRNELPHQSFMIILWVFGTVVYFNPFLHTLLSFISDNIAIKSNAIGFIIEITVFMAASGAAFALLYFHNSKKHTMTPKPAINAIFTAQGISMFFCACIAATFGVLFCHKWMTSSNLLGGQ